MRRCLAGIMAMAMLAASCSGSNEEESEARSVVRIFGPYRGLEADLFVAGLDDWADERAIDIRYTGSSAFIDDLRYQVLEIAVPPDIALVPQPGVVRSMVRLDRAVPIPAETEAAVAGNYEPSILDLGRIDGELVGLPYRTSAKSLVWYRPGVFAANRLEIPDSLEGLERLVDEIADLGLTPWCMGIEAGGATGWVATDWVEDLILRQWGAEVYTDWVAGTVPFADPRIAESFATFRSLALRPGRVAGGVAEVLSTNTQAADDRLFTDPPGCVLYRQSSTGFGWMPPGTTLGSDVDFFAFPGDPVTSGSMIAGLDLAVAFDDRPEVRAVLERLATPAAVAAWAAEGRFVSPLRIAEPATFYSPEDLRFAQELLDAEPLLPDGSDSMPGSIGTTLFWGEITRWLSSAQSYDAMAATMDAAFEALADQQ